MSVAAELQRMIAEKLASVYTVAVGDGVSTEFPIEHGFGTPALYAVVKMGGVALVNGVDYMLTFTDRDTVSVQALSMVPAPNAWAVKLTLLRLDATLTGATDRIDKTMLPIVPFKSKDMAQRVEGAAAARELAIYVWPVLPVRIVQGVPFVFVEKGEARVTIIEQPQINTRSADAYDLVDDVMHALHWQAFANVLAHPLQLAEKPTEMIWEPGTRFQGLAANTRMIDVIFEATYGLQPGGSQAFVTADNEVVTADSEIITADSEPVGPTADSGTTTSDSETTTADEE